MADRSAPGADPISDLDALRALEARLERATEAAERLLADAGQAPGPPPAGWQAPRDGNGAGGRDGSVSGDRFGGWLRNDDAEVLLALLAAVRDRIPTDLQQRLTAAVQEVLLALRALIDWCLERAERRRATPPEVQDIPIL